MHSFPPLEKFSYYIEMYLEHISIYFNIRDLNPFVNILLHKNRVVMKNNERKFRKMLECFPRVPYLQNFCGCIDFPFVFCYSYLMNIQQFLAEEFANGAL
ncbi:hypothetical protein CLOSTMETH_01797 [[Clostridium] methylpentosum DSM 5476]|uniref:Uncharacterized protein n=1 Tax=[Clostridium] methylpentosum DSM 5476 TaxID=537013 RepID=C0ED70_9FIRM|nr:hypothetical protein CLOSTMETH_01797 [[Clostridium] methylpentosum DSM 5476]